MLNSEEVESVHSQSKPAYREERENGMPLKDALAFFDYLINNPDEREKVQDATTGEIVLAGREAGYDFTEGDLDFLLQRFNAARMQPMAKLGCHATPAGDGGIWDR